MLSAPTFFTPHLLFKLAISKEPVNLNAILLIGSYGRISASCASHIEWAMCHVGLFEHKSPFFNTVLLKAKGNNLVLKINWIVLSCDIIGVFLVVMFIPDNIFLLSNCLAALKRELVV